MVHHIVLPPPLRFRSVERRVSFRLADNDGLERHGIYHLGFLLKSIPDGPGLVTCDGILRFVGFLSPASRAKGRETR